MTLSPSWSPLSLLSDLGSQGLSGRNPTEIGASILARAGICDRAVWTDRASQDCAILAELLSPSELRMVRSSCGLE